MAKQDETTLISHGVDALIEQLRSEGTDHGRAEGEKIIADAKIEAKQICEQANAEAQQLLKNARNEIDTLQRASQEALETAARDALLSLKSQLTHVFSNEVKRLIGERTKEKVFLEQMILEVMSKSQKDASSSTDAQVLLPKDIFGLEELRDNPDELEQGELTEFIKIISQKLMRDGVTFGVANEDQSGLKIKLIDKDIELDFSDQAIAEVLLEHLQPRFRALMEGIVK